MKSALAFVGLLMLCLSVNCRATPTSFFDLPVLQPNGQPGETYVPNDLDGDGTSDLLWFNPVTSQFGYWMIRFTSDYHFQLAGTRKIDITPGYLVGALGDFNRDGRVDVVWTSDNHDLYLWTSNGGTFNSAFIGTYPAGWKLMGAGDIDGDGYPDLLWWNESTSQFGYWLMHGDKHVGGRTFDVTPGYKLMGIGYNNIRRKLTLIWLNASGDVYGWDSTGGGFQSYLVGNFTRNSQRKFEAVKFKGDDVFFTITTADGSIEDNYTWIREFDAQGNPTSSRLSGALYGGWGEVHVSGEVYYRMNGATGGGVDVMTDRNGLAGYPQTLGISSYYAYYGINRSDDVYSSFPENWYMVGETWYRSDLITYGPASPP